MFWQYHKLTLNMKSDAKIERTPSCQFDIIFGKMSPVYPENLENRNFALDFLEIIDRKRQTLAKLAKNTEESEKFDIADF